MIKAGTLRNCETSTTASKAATAYMQPPREFNLNIRIKLSVIVLPRPYTYLDIKGYHLQGHGRLHRGICPMWEGDNKISPPPAEL